MRRPHCAHAVEAIQARHTDMPLGARGLGHEAFQHQCHRQRDDAEEDAGDTTEEHEIAEQQGEQRGDGYRQQQRHPGKSIGRAEIEGEDAVAVAGNAKERGLAERERAAIAPDQAQAERDEHPDKEINGVANGISVAEQRIRASNREHDGEHDPERRTAACGLRTFEAAEKSKKAVHCVGSFRCVRAAGSRRSPSAGPERR